MCLQPNYNIKTQTTITETTNISKAKAWFKLPFMPPSREMYPAYSTALGACTGHSLCKW